MHYSCWFSKCKNLPHMCPYQINIQLCIRKVCVRCLCASSLAIQVTYLSHPSRSSRGCKLLHSIQKYWIYKPTILPYRKEAESWKEEGVSSCKSPPPQTMLVLKPNMSYVVVGWESWKRREQWPCLGFRDSPAGYMNQTFTQIQHNNNHDT